MNGVSFSKPRQPRQLMWQALRAQRDKDWYVEELAEIGGVSRQAAHIYMHALVLAGYVAEHTGPQPGYTRPRKLYRLQQDCGRDAPRLKADGSPAHEPVQDVVWRTMKILRQFTVPELRAHVAMTHAVSSKFVGDYVRTLLRAGYLKHGGGGREKRYVLLRNTGARAPRLYLARELYDPNMDAIVLREVPDED